MSYRIVTLGISSERDMVAVRQRAREISDTLGFGSQDQVRIATAVSELARTVLSSATGGKVEFSVSDLGRGVWLRIQIQSGADRRSEADPRGLHAASARNDAMASAGRLMDSCGIEVAEEGSERLRSIVLGKALPPMQLVDTGLLRTLADRMAASPVVSTFSEVTLQNKELLDTLAELRIKQDALLVLTEELERTNRAVVALNANIEENAERLRQADIYKDEFLATLAHELRNPLAPIRNAVEVMRRVPPTNTESHARAQQIISRQVDHLAHLVDDLLDVARISKGKITLQQEVVDVGHFMHTAVETIRPFIESRGHGLTVEVPTERLQVMGDSVRLAQIVGNLLNNAAKYTLHGGRIALAARRIGPSAVQITVRDNGIGLSEERKQSIFGMFSQGASAPDRAQDGLGIGLSLVRQLTTLHGGLVWVDSDGEGHGSCFFVELPLHAPVQIDTADGRAAQVAGVVLRPAVQRSTSAVSAVSAVRPEPASAPADVPVVPVAGTAGPAQAPAAALKVLLVDDNHDSVAMTAMLLQACGHETVMAHDAAGGMALAMAHLPDVILLDIGLPGSDGYAVARMLRMQPALDGVCLIAMTGYGTDDDRKKARNAGFDHHLVKPVNAERLIALVATAGKALGRSAATPAAAAP